MSSTLLVTRLPTMRLLSRPPEIAKIYFSLWLLWAISPVHYRLNEREIYLKYLDTDKIKMRHKVSKSKLNLFDGLSLQWFSQG